MPAGKRLGLEAKARPCLLQSQAEIHVLVDEQPLGEADARRQVAAHQQGDRGKQVAPPGKEIVADSLVRGYRSRWQDQLFMAAIEHELAVVHGVAPAAVGPVHGELPAQLAGHPGIVGVEKGDDLAFGRIDAGVARRRAAAVVLEADPVDQRSEEHTSELQSLMRISYAVFCLKKKTNSTEHTHINIKK